MERSAVTVPVRQLRKKIPLSVKVEACLVRLGFTLEEIRTPGAIHWDHDPALGLRDQIETPAGIVFDPDQHDPRHIVPRRAEPHKVKTNGAGATCADGDTHKIGKARRLSKSQAAFRARLLAKAAGEPPPAPQKPKRKWASRPMRSKNHVRTNPR